MSNERSKYVSLSFEEKYEIACKLGQESVNLTRLAKGLKIIKFTLNDLRNALSTRTMRELTSDKSFAAR